MDPLDLDVLPGVHPSPNIQTDPERYELENQAADPEGWLWKAMSRISGWQGRTVLDLGAGTGYHLPRFAASAGHVIAVEPHGPSRLRIARRIAERDLENVSLLAGSAEAIPLPDRSIDVCHCRFAYFFGTERCLPGLRELARVMRPGGTAFIIDNHLSQGSFARWLYLAYASYQLTQAEVEAFWQAQGFDRVVVPSEWRFERREDLEAVVRLEFGDAAERLLAEHAGTRVDYHYCLYWKRYGSPLFQGAT
ncbi:MAG: methyltransferase domain-containing protein [Caldilineae bacterium]|nr:methyltransferase domain-containing protein [Caldilineae bacterium]